MTDLTAATAAARPIVITWPDDDHLMTEATDDAETPEEFGRATGECGECGRTLDAVDREAGICHGCSVDREEG